VAKYNQLLRIEEEIGAVSRYPGLDAGSTLKRNKMPGLEQ